MSDNEKEYCICRSTDISRFMIGCDLCDEWYHGDCINVQPFESKYVKKFYCKRCLRSNPNLKIVFKEKYMERIELLYARGRLSPIFARTFQRKHKTEVGGKRPKSEEKRPEEKGQRPSVSSLGTSKTIKASRCGQCEPCRRSSDCNKCDSCRDAKMYPDMKRKRCILRKCKNPIPKMTASSAEKTGGSSSSSSQRPRHESKVKSSSEASAVVSATDESRKRKVHPSKENEAETKKAKLQQSDAFMSAISSQQLMKKSSEKPTISEKKREKRTGPQSSTPTSVEPTNTDTTSTTPSPTQSVPTDRPAKKKIDEEKESQSRPRTPVALPRTPPSTPPLSRSNSAGSVVRDNTASSSGDKATIEAEDQQPSAKRSESPVPPTTSIQPSNISGAETPAATTSSEQFRATGATAAAAATTTESQSNCPTPPPTTCWWNVSRERRSTSAVNSSMNSQTSVSSAGSRAATRRNRKNAAISKLPLLQCYGPSCRYAARIGSKYCSDACGRRLAEQRLRQVLPDKLAVWKKSTSVARCLGNSRLRSLHRQQKITNRRLRHIEHLRTELESLIATAKQTKTASDDAETENYSNEDQEAQSELYVFCVTCGHAYNPKAVLRHMERCFAKFEATTTFCSVYPSRIGSDLFCEFYNQQSRTYCKRLRVICPDHRREPKHDVDEVCGCPITESGVVVDPFVVSSDSNSAQFCTVSRRKCTRHFNWENLRRAELDLERVRQWMKLEELLEQVRACELAINTRGSLFKVMQNQTIDTLSTLSISAGEKSIAADEEASSSSSDDEVDAEKSSASNSSSSKPSIISKQWIATKRLPIAEWKQSAQGPANWSQSPATRSPTPASRPETPPVSDSYSPSNGPSPPRLIRTPPSVPASTKDDDTDDGVKNDNTNNDDTNNRDIIDDVKDDDVKDDDVKVDDANGDDVKDDGINDGDINDDAKDDDVKDDDVNGDAVNGDDMIDNTNDNSQWSDTSPCTDPVEQEQSGQEAVNSDCCQPEVGQPAE